MFHINSDLERRCDAVVASLNRRQSELMEEFGQAILSLQQLSFEKKSRGGTGDDGISWKPLAESTERKKFAKGRPRPGKTKGGTRRRRPKLVGPVPRSQIGVDTGELRNSPVAVYNAPSGGVVLGIGQVIAAPMDIGNVTDSLSVAYNAPHAEWFDHDRPLMAVNMPAAWQRKLERIAGDWLSDIAMELQG
jgi:hypothetical protein